MAPVQLYFTSHNSAQLRPTRVDELEIAARRAHAAKVAHQRRQTANFRLRAKAAKHPPLCQLSKKERRQIDQIRSSDEESSDGELYGRDHSRSPVLWAGSNAPCTAILLSSNPLIHGNSDPFLTTPTPVTPTDHQDLRAFEGLLWHISWPNHSGVIFHPFSDAWSKLLSTSFSSESSLEALLATTSIYVKSQVSDSTTRAQCTDGFLQHRAASLKALRTEMCAVSRGVRPTLSTIMAVLFQTFSLALSEDNMEAKLHFQGLHGLVRAYGGLMSLPYPARCMVAAVDNAVSVGSMQRLTWPSDLYDPGPPNLNVLEQRTFDAIQSNWPPLSKAVPDSLQKFFMFYREMNAVHQTALDIVQPYRRTEVLRWVLHRSRVMYSKTQDMRCSIAEKGRDLAEFSDEDILQVVRASVHISVQYLFRVIYWPKPGQATIQADMNDIQIWFACPGVRSKIPPLLMLYLLAACTALERHLRLVRTWPWWHAPRFLLLTEHMFLDNIEALTFVMERFVWAAEPIGRYIEDVFEQRESIYAESNCRPVETLSLVERTGNTDLIWDAPRSRSLEPLDRTAVVNWTNPERVRR